MKRISLLLASALIASASLVAHADTFQYNVVFNNGQTTTDATFDSPSILTSTTTYIPATGTGSQGSILSVSAYPILNGCYNGFDACFITNSQAGGDVLYFHTNVESVGTYFDVFGNGMLTISKLSSPAPTPEPSSLLLLGSGLLGMGGVLKRKWQISAAE
ncbi:hypothetical protein GCM10011507_16640 [Edaphobacter acidisoli]|uniref:Ice-binding protein C-terminal domain-containing protein n=1 Tax=Edaphobacter acidisoli TaxID=2040573 RepID=A0A916RQ68_9BACT|nr:PEP-CTERM sorting domain-containing protein [Edaphobacter acidisoli]GGA65747.1 hypothetical protein GCM10011507_16640 [Edaphobacter acidisoli]